LKRCFLAATTALLFVSERMSHQQGEICIRCAARERPTQRSSFLSLPPHLPLPPSRHPPALSRRCCATDSEWVALTLHRCWPMVQSTTTAPPPLAMVHCSTDGASPAHNTINCPRASSLMLDARARRIPARYMAAGISSHLSNPGPSSPTRDAMRSMTSFCSGSGLIKSRWNIWIPYE